MHTTIITGINGFVGHHLAHEMHQRGVTVIGVGQGPDLAADLTDVVDRYCQCDLTQPEALQKLPLVEANSIVNLAGLANVGASFGKSDLYETSNTNILKNLCQAMQSTGSQARLLAISTGAVYDPAQSGPFTEDSALVDANRTSPYAKSKLLMEVAAHEYIKDGMACYIVRPFNHLGPGQKPGFLLPDLAAKIHQAVTEGKTEILVGNLQSQRDFTDVRDVAKAYAEIALADAGALHQHVYNVCSGVGLSGQQIFDHLLKAMGSPAITPKTDPNLLRANDPKVLVGNFEAVHKDVGWQPTISIDQTVQDFVAWLKTN